MGRRRYRRFTGRHLFKRGTVVTLSQLGRDNFPSCRGRVAKVVEVYNDTYEKIELRNMIKIRWEHRKDIETWHYSHFRKAVHGKPRPILTKWH